MTASERIRKLREERAIQEARKSIPDEWRRLVAIRASVERDTSYGYSVKV